VSARWKSASIALALLAACKGNPSNSQILEWAARAEKGAVPPLRAEHAGPAVARGDTGTARFARDVYEAFRVDRALDVATFADRFYREPANEGYDAVIDRIVSELKSAGFGTAERLELEVLESRVEANAWTPRSAKITLRGPAGDRVLHAFARGEDRDRTMLPRNAPSAHVEGEIVLKVDDVRPGTILVTDASLSRGLIERAQSSGAAALLSSSLAKYNVDPSGKELHKDAIQYRSVDRAVTLPVAQISPRSFEAIQEAAKSAGAARIAFDAQVEIASRPLRTVVATIAGVTKPDEAVAIAAHVQEPGACDNASGVATMLECARDLGDLVRGGTLAWPAKSIVFVWGNEIEESRVLLEHSSRAIVSAIAADMTGESEAATGAIALLERPPDPGAITPLAPDEHTPWGAAHVDAASLRPSGISVVARTALVDVGSLVASWKTREHPFEGGSDHTVFLDRGIPAVLFWHFTDFAYHTSLDRLDHLDPEEMHRTGTVIAITALALADAKPIDLDRYLATLKLESDLRIAACEEKGDAELAAQWREWVKGARLWLRALCLGEPATAPTPSPATPPAPGASSAPATPNDRPPSNAR
jgi:hypothetical protein